MTTRRQFIAVTMTAGLTATTVSGVGKAMAFPRDGGSHLRLERVIFDERFVDARAFAAEARTRMVATSSVSGSIHDLWYNDLYHRWHEGKTPIAGMTNHNALFLLEMMAADAGMRVVHRVHHLGANGRYDHRMFGPLKGRDEMMRRLSDARKDWRYRAADIVLSWPDAPTPVAPVSSDILQAKSQALDSRTLVSWIIR